MDELVGGIGQRANSDVSEGSKGQFKLKQIDKSSHYLPRKAPFSRDIKGGLFNRIDSTGQGPLSSRRGMAASLQSLKIAERKPDGKKFKLVTPTAQAGIKVQVKSEKLREEHQLWMKLRLKATELESKLPFSAAKK